jgi:ligand-binding SRPBCC domain-containing protein
MKRFVLQTEQLLPRPLEEVFRFFSDPGNLQRITPPWLDFEILHGHDAYMRAGLLIEYRLRIHGIPLRWRSEITVWDPPIRFVDEQRRGPYRLWIHEHSFEEKGNDTLVRDRVQYAVPGGILAQKLFVARDVDRIFAFRRQKLAEIFART